VGRGCLPGDEKLVAKGGRTACRVVIGKGEVSLFFFFRPCAGRRRHRTNRFGRPARRGSPLSTQPPSTVYIDHALSLSRVCSPISPWGADRQHLLPPSVKGPRRRRSSRRRCPLGSERRRRHPARCASTDAAANASLGGCQF